MTIKRKMDDRSNFSVNCVSKKKRKLHISPSGKDPSIDTKKTVKDDSAVKCYQHDLSPKVNSGPRKELSKKNDRKKRTKRRKKVKTYLEECQKSDSVYVKQNEKDVKFHRPLPDTERSEKGIKCEKERGSGDVTSVCPHDSKERTTGRKWKKRFKNKKSNKRLKLETDGKPVSEKLPEKPATEKISCNWKALQQILKKTKKPTYHRRPKPGKDKPETESKSEIWFDDVDDILIETLKKKEEKALSANDLKKTEKKSDDRLVKSGSYTGLTKVVAMDCEMVGVGNGGHDSVLARVSIVNHFGHCVYDKYVKPQEEVTDYRTPVSGIRPEDIKDAPDFTEVQKEVSDIMKDRIVVGHALENDFKVLFLDHPRRRIRDTSTYKPFRKLFNGGKPSLKKLSEKVLMVNVQEGEHNSVQDAQAAMRLYTMYAKQWEKDLQLKRRGKPQTKVKKNNSLRSSS